jgi:putative methionine-R-sulfoxide reductase with GAF domain
MADGKTLELVSGLYDDMPYFEAVSRGMTLGLDEGLPGKAWAQRHPVILKNLSNSYFRRGDAAFAESLSCAIALPIFRNDELTAVLVQFFGDNRYQRGAVEVWHAPAGAAELALADGYFGRADGLARDSRQIRFACGEGIPGSVWQSGMPLIVADVPGDDVFLRRDAAERMLLHRAVGIPCSASDAGHWVMTFLSVRNAPLARRFEVWVPDASLRKFTLAAGYCEIAGALQELHATTDVPIDSGLLAKVRSSGVPVIGKDLSKLDDAVARAASAAGLVSLIAMPIFTRGDCTAIVAWYP